MADVIVGNVKGIPIRVASIYPEYVIGIDNNKYLTLFWEGYEIARIEDSRGKLRVTNSVDKYRDITSDQS